MPYYGIAHFCELIEWIIFGTIILKHYLFMVEKLGQFFKFAGKFMLYFWGCIGVIIAYHVLPAFLVIAAFVLLLCGSVYWSFRLLKALCRLILKPLNWI